MRSKFASASTLCWLTAALTAQASDGVLEINQTCAVETGCFSGDVAGFPVTIDGSAGKSYRLSSDLSIATDVDGIVITSSYVTLDLNGFEIAGNTTCTGTGATLSCGTGAGSGVFASGSPTGITIRNGTLRNHQLMAIRAEGNGHRVQDVLARHNGSDGINLEFRSLCHRCTAIENERDGIRMNQGAVVESSVAQGNGREGIVLTGNGGVVSGSTSTGNGGTGIQLSGESGTVFGSSSRENVGQGFFLQILSKFGKDNVSGNNGSPDSCGGGICTDRKRYYRSIGSVRGDGASSNCAAGFHFASLPEIKDTGSLAYDVQLGQTEDDSGEGPPAKILEPAWIRSGTFASSISLVAGEANCNGWSLSISNVYGSLIRLGGSWTSPGTGISPWAANIEECNRLFPTWCVEDE